MAESAGIIIFTLWYIAIAYNYAVEHYGRCQKGITNKRLSQLSSIHDDDEEIEDINESVDTNHNVSEQPSIHAKAEPSIYPVEEYIKEPSAVLETPEKVVSVDDIVKDVYDVAEDVFQQDDSTEESAAEED